MSWDRAERGRGRQQRITGPTTGRDGDAEAGRERGAALILVMIFGAGLMTTALLLLTLTERTAKVTASREDTQVLQTLVRHAVADVEWAVNGYFRARAAGDTPSTTNVGAFIDPVPVLDSAGRMIGEYKATFDYTSVNLIRLTVVAATPRFDHAEQKAGAQFLITRSNVTIPGRFGGDKEPFQINGNVDDVHDVTLGDSNAKIKVNGADAAGNGQDQAAGRIQDSEVMEEIVDNLIEGPGAPWAIWSGNKADDPSTPASGADTLLNADPTYFTQDELDALYTAFDNYADSLIAAGTVNDNAYGHGPTTVIADDPNDVVVAGENFALNGAKVTGTGTLVVPPGRTLTISGSSQFTWTGDIVVWGDGALVVEDNAKFDLTGNLLVDATGDGADVAFTGNGFVDINGSMTVISTDDEAGIVHEGTSQVTLNGVFLAYGKDVHVKLASNTHFDINGSMILNVADDGDLTAFEIGNNGHLEFNFHSDNFETGVAGITQLAEKANAELPGSSNDIIQIVITTYLEGAPKLLEQQLETDADQGSGPGFPVTHDAFAE